MLLVLNAFKTSAKYHSKKNNCRLCESREVLAKHHGFSDYREFLGVCKRNPSDNRLKSAFLKIVGLGEDRIESHVKLKGHLLRVFENRYRPSDGLRDTSHKTFIDNLSLRRSYYRQATDIYTIAVDFEYKSSKPKSKIYRVTALADITSYGHSLRFCEPTEHISFDVSQCSATGETMLWFGDTHAKHTIRLLKRWRSHSQSSLNDEMFASSFITQQYGRLSSN